MERQSTRKLFKLVIALVALFTLALSVFAFGACGGEEHKHVYESSGKTAANCGKIGVETFTCSCGDTYVAVTPATGSHKWGADGYCETCGLPNFGAKDPVFPTIPDGFTAEDLAAIQKAITDSQKGITDAQQAAHDALGQKIDGLDTHPVHKFEKEGAVKNLTMPGSCTTYGVKFTLSTCDVCGATFLTGIEKDGKLGHKEKTVTLDPTCQEFGYIQKICETCGELLSTQTLNTVAHDHSVKSAQSVEPGCVTDGLYVYECKWCHEIQPQYNEVKKANPGHHTMPETAKPEDCTVEGGTVTYECTVCGEETTENFEKKSAHEWVYSDVEMTLCGESATVTRSCKNCKVVEENVTVTKDMTDVVTALGDKWSTAHPERTTEADKVVYVPYKDKAGNALDNWTKFKADNGLTDDADPANLKEGSEGYNANNNVVKYTYYECATCGQPIKVASEAETHNFRVDTTKADWAGHKLDTDGNPIAECEPYTAHWKCIDSSCKDLDISYEQLVKELGHDWSADAWDDTSAGVGRPSAGWIYLHLPSCSDEGEAYRYCKRCNVDEDGNYDKTKTCGYETHSVSKVPHRIDRTAETYDYKAPTCTEDGYEKGPCQVCGQEDAVENVLPKTEHTWKYDVEDTSTWEVVWGNDDRFPCRSTLVINYCTKCNPDGKNTDCDGYKEFKTAAKAEHQALRVKKVNTAPTCTTAGNVTYICDLCMETWSEDVDPLGHLWATPEGVVDGNGNHWSDVRFTKPATCTEDGYTGYWCVRPGCGVHSGPEIKGSPYVVLEATGHTIAGKRLGYMNAFGVIVWNYGDTLAEFDELNKNSADCRDYLYTRDFCMNCDWVSDVIYKTPLKEHEWQWRTDWDELTPEQQLQAAENGDFYELHIITPATCEDIGAYGYKCKQCGEVVFQGYYGPYGHWYYDVSRSEAAGMSADQLEKHLNVVGQNESSCLAPGSVTVECVYCGVRYAYGTSTDPETMGHSWKLIDATNNANILCGDYLSSKTLAYCEKCGLVAELTGTTLPAKNYATYLGKEDLTETQLEALKDLLDENDNLNVNKKDVVKPVETDTPEATDEPTETPTTEYYDTDGLIGLIVEAFKDTTKIQMHKFDSSDPNLTLWLVAGDCTTPGISISVCKICGVNEEGKADPSKLLDDDLIGAEKDENGNYVVNEDGEILVNSNYFDGWCAQYYDTTTGTPNPDKMKKLTGWDKETGKGGYTVFATEATKADREAAFKAAMEAYAQTEDGQKSVGLWLGKASAGEKSTQNPDIPSLDLYIPYGAFLYTGYNFTAFETNKASHDWLIEGTGDCLADPVLTLIFEDWVGIAQGSKGAAWDCTTAANGAGFVDTWCNSNYGTAFSNEEGEWNTFGGLLAKGDGRLAALSEEYADTAWANVSLGDYAEVFTFLKSLTSTGKSGTARTELAKIISAAGYHGINNWCKADNCPSKANGAHDHSEDTLCYGFKPATDHNLVYNIYENKPVSDAFFGTTSETGENIPTNFVLGEKALTAADLTSEEAVKAVENDLRFVQWLIDNKTEAEKNNFTASYLTKYASILDANVLSVAGEITCIVEMKCANDCGFIPVTGKHQGSGDNQAYEGNCQRGALCVACGETLGRPGDHNLVDVQNEAVQALFPAEGDKTFEKFMAQTAFSKVELNLDGFVNKCWLGAEKKFDKLEVCVGCIEAWLGNYGTAKENVTWTAKSEQVKTGNYVITDDATTVDKVEHTYKLDATSARALIKEFSDKFPGIDLEDTTTNTDEVVIAAVKDYILGKGDSHTGVLTFKVGSQVVSVTIDEENYLVLTYKGGTNEGDCVGEVYSQDLCFFCALHWEKEGVVDVSETKKGETFGIRTAAVADSTAHNQEATGGKYNVQPVRLHVYAPDKDTMSSGEYRLSDGVYVIDVVCLRCGIKVTMPVSQLKSGYSDIQEKWLQWVFVEKVADLEDAKVKAAVPDVDTLKTTYTDKACDMKETFSYATTSEKAVEGIKEVAAAADGGIVEIAEGVAVDLSGKGQDEVLAVKGETEIKLAEGASLTLDASKAKRSSDQAPLTAIYANNNGSLKIEGGVVDVKIDNSATTTAIGAANGGKIEFVDTVIHTNACIQAETGAEIVFTRTTCFADYYQTISTNNSLTTGGVKYTITDSKIINTSLTDDRKAGNTALMINNTNVELTATNSLFYGLCVAVWVRAGVANFTNCEFVTGGFVTSGNPWGQGGSYKSEATAALVVGSGSGNYGNADVKLTSCEYVLSYEYAPNYTHADGNKVDSLESADKSLVKYNKDTNEFTYEPYTGDEMTTKPYALTVTEIGSGTAKVTFDQSSADSFGINNSYLQKNKNVFYESGASEQSAIVVQIGETAVTINS